MGVIYVIKNIVNNKAYIGQTVDFDKRKLRHLRNATKGDERPLYRTIRKYGYENHLLNLREKYWISKYDSFLGEGYNLTSGGGQNFEISQETRKKLSESHKGKTHSQKTKQRLREIGLKFRHSEESKAKISNANSGRKFTTEQKKKFSASAKERMKSRSVREKISLKLKGRKLSEETRRKMSEAHKRKHARKKAS